MYLLDTNAVIYYVKDESNVVSVIEDIYTKNIPVYLSVITEAELFAFPQLSDDEAERIEKFLQSVSGWDSVGRRYPRSAREET